MSKQVKQMEMETLRQQLSDAREFVFLGVSGLTCQTDNQLRGQLRKKKIRVLMVKNSLTRRVFDEMGIHIDQDTPYWKGTTWLAWGPDSVAELSQELRTIVTKNTALKDKIQFKGAVAEGNPLPFETALTMPTRAQALSQLLGMILSPASQIAGLLVGPVSQVASQIQTISEKTEGAAEAEQAPAPAP